MPRRPAYTRDTVDAFLATVRGGRDRPPIPRDLPPLTAADGDPEPPLPDALHDLASPQTDG